MKKITILLVPIIIALSAALLYMAYNNLNAGDQNVVAETVSVDAIDQGAESKTGQTIERNVQRWNVVKDKSSLQFQANALGKKFIGQFNNFSSDIYFDPNNLENSYALIKVETGSVDSQDGDRDDHMKSADWFYITSYPEAIFETIAFEQAADGEYVAVANLTIRDVTMPVTMPFSVEVKKDGKHAHVKGRVNLNRLSFGLGKGEFDGDDSVDTGVIVAVDLTATAN